MPLCRACRAAPPCTLADEENDRVSVPTRGNQTHATELLGLNRNMLRKKIRDRDSQVVRKTG
jgi:Bacterial regulatory protein, Fis family